MPDKVDEKDIRAYQRAMNKWRDSMNMPRMTLPEAREVFANLEATAEAMKVCERQGHVSSGSGQLSGRGTAMNDVHDVCQRCGMPYRRPPTYEERQSWDDLMRTPFGAHA